MAPFDAAAASYDSNSHNNLMMRWLRNRNLAHLVRAFSPGDLVLEVGCGSGVEAIALAKRGISVVATDASPEMIRVLATKLTSPSGNALSVTPKLLPAQELATLVDEFGPGAFDGAYSSLGPLNCLPGLDQVVTDLGELVRPGGTVAVSLLGKFCLWEVAWYLAVGRPDLAFRRWSGQAVGTSLPGSRPLTVYYWPLDQIERTFGKRFVITHRESLPWALPPTYAAGFIARRPLLRRALSLIERLTRTLWPFHALGDHIYLEMVRRA